MKKFFLMSSFLFLSLYLFSQETAKQIYEVENLKNILIKHKVVAILPFNVSITYKRPPKNYDESQHINEQNALSKNLQSEMFTYLLRKKDEYFVSFQDVDKTNSLLRKNNLMDKLDEMTGEEISQILGVDAVIKCNYSYEKTSSEGGAIAKTVLMGGIGSKTATGTMAMQIKNGGNGELLWRFSKKMDETVFSSAGQLMERMMKKVARNFPYEK